MTVTTFNPTGAMQTWTAPAGATSVIIECFGAPGGAVAPVKRGDGGYAKGSLVVAPGTVLNLFVGGTGGEGGSGGAGAGWNGGGAGNIGGNGGGGATDVRIGGTALANRVIVAGGGGAGGTATGTTSNSELGGRGGGASGLGLGDRYPGTQTSGYALGQGGPSNFGGGGGYYGGFGGLGTWKDSSFNDVLFGGAGGSGYLSAALTDASMVTGGNSYSTAKIVLTVTNVAPFAPTLTVPASNTTVFAADPLTLAWTFSDADLGDYQTRADLRFKKVGDVSWTTVTNAATTASTYVLAAGTWALGFQYEWQVSCFDVAAMQSPWSASSFASTIATVPAPTITAPAPGSSQFTTPVGLEWSLPASFIQDACQVQRVENADGSGVVYYDSGIVVTASTSAQVPLEAVSGRTDYLRVAFRHLGHWSPFTSVAIDAQFGPPWVPLVVATPDPATASVRVQITNPASSGGYASTVTNDVYRTGPDGVRARIATDVSTSAAFVDWLPGAGRNVYTVTAFAASGSSSASL